MAATTAEEFMNRSNWLIIAAALLTGIFALACQSDDPKFETAVSPIHTERNYFKDAEGRYVHFRGINVSGDAKVPRILDVPLDNGRDFTFVGRPFPIEEADRWFSQIKSLGFNAVRLLFIWEAVFPDSRDQPDEDFLEYFEQVVKKADEHGIYVLINMHENLWGRDMVALYNEDAPGARGDIENMLYSLLPPYTNKVVGDGAPRWATKACLPFKNWESENWGMSALLGAMAKDVDGIPGSDFLFTLGIAAPLLGFELPDGLVDEIESKLPATFPRTDTAAMLPWSSWWNNTIFSLDIQRCYAAFFDGDKIFPSTVVEPDGTVKNRDEEEISEDAMDLKEYLQGSFTQAYVEVAKRVGKYPNVIGYDIMNEPTTSFYVFSAIALFFEVGNDAAVKELLNILLPNDAGIGDSLKLPGEPVDNCEESCPNNCTDICQMDCSDVCGDDEACKTMCKQQVNSCTKLCKSQIETCTELCRDPDRGKIGSKLFYLLKFLEILPPDTEWETKVAWGFGDVDLFEVINLNDAFDVFFLQPLFERVGQAIQEVDPDAIIWIEPSNSGALLSETYMTKPEGVDQVVYAPHYYPDIYPFWGFNMPERDFSIDEIQYRDYTADLETAAQWSTYTLSNIPVAFGEFGTYWNYKYKGEDWEEKGIEQSIRNDYSLSANILDNYYESYEKLFMSNFVWCYSTVNTYENGEGWNHEDFSVIDPQQEPRGALAYSRPYPKALSGKPISLRFYSDYHYYDPEKGKPDPRREFELVFASKETNAPTVLFVPNIQYPEGFYVWLSDGWMAWDAAEQTMYFYPTTDDPDWQHRVLIRPPIDGQAIEGWSYFVKGEQVISR
jgi:hypothetical protein